MSSTREGASSKACFRRVALAHPATIFVVLSMLFGAAIIAITAPLRGPDEAAHFLRAYGIAQGDLVPSQADGMK